MRADVRGSAHLEHDEPEQAGLPVDPGAGHGEALHGKGRGVDPRGLGLEVLQAVELAGMESPRRRRGADHHFDDGRGEAVHRIDPRPPQVVEPGHQGLCAFLAGRRVAGQ